MSRDVKTLDALVTTSERRARRAYELGMLARAATRAALVTGVVALLSVAGVAPLPSYAWLVPVLLVWVLLAWRGALVWRGALGGLVAGLGALALPLSVLRPCCTSMMNAASCSMPQVCWGAGALLGLVVAMTLPRLRTPSEWARAAGGALAAVASLVAPRCFDLFVGEAVGLAGGLMASAAAVALARAWWSGRTVTR